MLLRARGFSPFRFVPFGAGRRGPESGLALALSRGDFPRGKKLGEKRSEKISAPAAAQCRRVSFDVVSRKTDKQRHIVRGAKPL